VNRYCYPCLAPYELACVTVVRGLHRITFRVDDNSLNGTLSQSYSNMDAMSYELSDGVRAFFTNHDGGIFTSSYYSMAIMKTGNGFWLFNSHKTDKYGLHAVNGKAALIRFESIIVMVNHLRKLFTCMDVWILSTALLLLLSKLKM